MQRISEKTLAILLINRFLHSRAISFSFKYTEDNIGFSLEDFAILLAGYRADMGG